jgi:RimJ/RimL family protein N-acetyltransferase
MELITKFMMIPEILERAREDGATISPVFTCGDREGWLVAMKGGEVIAAINLHLESGIMAQFHPYFLSAHSREASKIVKLFLIWFRDEMPIEITKLIAFIPTYAAGVYRAALRLGFTHEGTNRACFQKNGIIYDMNLVGIIREEIKWQS